VLYGSTIDQLTQATILEGVKMMQTLILMICRRLLMYIWFTYFRYSSYLIQCISQNTGYLGVTCTTNQIETSIQSYKATVWLFIHYPGIQMRKCFQVMEYKRW